MTITKTLTAYPSEQEPLGFFRIFATPPGGFQREITLFRGAPVKLGTVVTQDPFTDVTAQLSLPQVTVFDTPGEGDLDWLVPDCDLDIVWTNVGGYDFEWRWEGYLASYSFSLAGTDASFTLDCKGAFYGLDDYLAKPGFPLRPIPYEILIAQAFDQDSHPSRLGKFRIAFPEDWDLTVPEFDDPRYLSALKPWGIATGARWTGFTSRNTGSWEALLSGHVQGLLSVMFAEGGSQWSIRNRGQRRPELYLRRIPELDADDIIEIQLGAPGVSMDASRDFTQRAGVIYGSGTDDAGIAFSNIEVSPDGRKTYFKPFAHSPRYWPRKNNPRFDKKLKSKEVMLRFQDGVDEVSAMKIAQGQYQRFSEPGITGSITLTTDPRNSDGSLMPRLLIKGGRTIRIHGLFGIREGVLAHVTQVSSDFTALSTTLTFDTKYRDQLTVEEVRARTRDALTPLRALQVGKYSNTIQDLILPWSYQAGSGVIPTPAKEFFHQKLPAGAQFPYEEWTKKYPPSNPAYAPWYIKIGPTDPANSNNNWSCERRDGRPSHAIAIRMSAGGTIRLTQMAAYDKHGNVLPVKFHLSVYSSNGVAVDGMPQFPSSRIPNPDDEEGPDVPNPEFPKYLAARKVSGEVIPTTYGSKKIDGKWVNQTHPFYQGGFESVQPDGTNFPWGETTQLAEHLEVGWGNYYEPAGYSPGRFSKGASRTGLLQDSTPWQWDVSAILDKDKPVTNRERDDAGMLYVMIYCDDQDDRPVFFMGRFIRQEPGQGT